MSKNLYIIVNNDILRQEIRTFYDSILCSESQQKACSADYFPDTIFLMSLSLFSASRGVRLLTSSPRISSRT